MKLICSIFSTNYSSNMEFTAKNFFVFLILIALLFISITNYIKLNRTNECKIKDIKPSTDIEEKFEDPTINMNLIDEIKKSASKKETKVDKTEEIPEKPKEEHHQEVQEEHHEETKSVEGDLDDFTNPIPKPEDYDSIYSDLLSKIPKEHHPSEFVIGIIASNRPHYLKALFQSLRRLLYWNKEKTILFQYGDNNQINDLVEKLGIRQVKNPISHQYQGVGLTEGAQHIALHYKFTLTKIFDELYPDIKYAILIEDDMILSPDFLLYFSQMCKFINDPTVYAISAFNDNGFVGQVEDDKMVYKTDFFIGLGWLVSGNIWRNEWSRVWPMNHWDHFLRMPQNRKGRSTIYPEVPRVYHSGYKGTHSDIGLFEKYFRSIKLNMNGHSILKTDHLLHYDDYVSDLMSKSKKVYHLNDILKYKNEAILLPFQFGQNDRNWEIVANYFKIWHSLPIRGEYKGIVYFKWAHNLILMKRDENGVPIEEFNEKRIWERNVKDIIKIVTTELDQSCDEKCGDLKCDVGFMNQILNNCNSLRKYFDCKECIPSSGSDQPAIDWNEKRCLWNVWGTGYYTSCSAKHGKTKRLCGCHNPEESSKIIEKEYQKFIFHNQGVKPNK